MYILECGKGKHLECEVIETSLLLLLMKGMRGEKEVRKRRERRGWRTFCSKGRRIFIFFSFIEQLHRRSV